MYLLRLSLTQGDWGFCSSACLADSIGEPSDNLRFVDQFILNRTMCDR